MELSNDRIRLLENIAYDQFGSAVGEITSILLKRGALTLSDLVSLSSLPIKLVQESLLVLSLHDALYHARPYEGVAKKETYEINIQGLEGRMRGALYAEMAVKEGGVEWGTIVEVLWREGIAKPAEIIEELIPGITAEQNRALELEREEEEARGHKAGKKGKRKLDALAVQTPKEIAMEKIEAAHRAGIIVVATVGSRSSRAALNERWEYDLKFSIKGMPTAKQLKEVKSQLKVKRTDWEADEILLGRGKEPQDSVADKGPDSTRKKKTRVSIAAKARGMSGSATPAPDTGFTFRENALYRINPEQFHILWRNKAIANFAAKRYNRQLAQVLKAVLHLGSSKVESMLEPQSRSVSSFEIKRAFEAQDKLSKLANGLAKSSREPSYSTPGLDSILSTYCSILCAEDDTTLLRKAFLTAGGSHARSQASNSYRVQYESIALRMKRSLVEAMIEAKFSISGIRCWRILESKGKLDEKHLAKLAFLPVKDARETISRLAAASLIEPQEVPRSADRAPSRTFYLWYVDYDKVVHALLNHHYKALANIQVQRQHQLNLRATLVKKRNRPEVRANPTIYLTVSDRMQLKELDKVVVALTVAEMRIDEDLFVLRDMGCFD